ncbi:glycosyltransferase N-terminal domain-containing protein [Wenyingzhuangia sp. chi5]|uniref:3-deoxy-D-manno-octulosonic acid transferase n=1 Tax=Wenyingzhuangia gilva TaxID=3057677 RepID=A0ABT8VQ34_9FLAO|nr:glycosyltransferase N-terminal domain-containing protein [Wenyingzhuangia sp. chi5]MDO3694085.1 glycosyltransferase N-terminal domain-containing protein [Wenyingzhuangia sp. chi5]
MRFLYNIFVYLAVIVLKLIALFSTKIKLFVEGRQEVFQKLKNKINLTHKTVWIHAASLGEFEQGRPVIEEIKKEYPEYQIVVTFFSPSGYEVRKNYELANVVCYLPLDTIDNAKKFIKLVQPSVAIFIKYEIWPNYLIELKKQNIPTLLVSGIFRENQIFFKSYGGWMRKSLNTFTSFFVQDETSKELLNSIAINEVSIVGDTRFDRVQKLVETNEKLPFVNDFKNESYLLVAGSTWLEDEEKLLAYINNIAKKDEKFIIAPHNIKAEEILRLKNSLQKKTVLFTEKAGKNLSDYQVMIVDTVGILSKIYAYANVAYIGGGYTKSGVHNTLEAATYGLPIVIGPNFKKFKEVKDLVSLKGCVSVNNSNDLSEFLKSMYQDSEVRAEKSRITKNYVTQNLGATQKIMKTVKAILSNEKE